MAQSFAKILVQLVFSTKNREPTIPAEIRPELHAYLVGILANLRCPASQVGETADHVARPLNGALSGLRWWAIE